MAETKTVGDAEVRRTQVIQIYNQACNTVAMQPLVERTEGQVLLLFCPSDKEPPGLGEFAVMHNRLAGRTLVKNCYHVRGPAFDLSSPQSWPIQGPELDAAARALAQFDLVPPD